MRQATIFNLLLISLSLTPSVYAQFGADPAGLTAIEKLIERIIFLFVGLAFISLLVMLVMSGFKYLTSGGEPKAIQSASQTMTWALLGMLFLVIAWLILLLIGAFTGITDLTKFDIRKLCVPSIADLCP